MQVLNPNNIKIYNLSAGKSLPEWLSDRKKRQMLKKDKDLQTRIELIQDFDMPSVSNCIQVSKDNQYIFATGVYKPRLKCYDVSHHSLKFERCFDSEVIKFLSLSDDYSKLVLLQDDRYLEFHAQMGHYYRLRVPQYGRDMSYHSPSCDLYVAGCSPEINRFNLEQGRFLNSLSTSATEVMCCQFNPEHQLFCCGTKQGMVECWDPRTRRRVGILDTGPGLVNSDIDFDGVPSVTSLTFKDGLHMAVGTSTGQILLYDIRSTRPLLVKDHNYGLPIKKIIYHTSQGLILSLDSKILKLWKEKNGKPYTSIESPSKLNDLCIFPNSGLLMMANEAPKMQTYYIPALGPAPKWAQALDSLTEELEVNPASTVYDDYKFVSTQELQSLGLTDLIGTNMLRAYMHGYFMDIRFYNKAKALASPVEYSDYKKRKIKEKIEEERANRVKVKKLPRVNKMLATKIMDAEEQAKERGVKAPTTLSLKDKRFGALFTNPDFEIDTESTDYRLLNPLIAKLNKTTKTKTRDQEFGDELRARLGNEHSDESDGDVSDSSSDDDQTWREELKKQHRLIRKEYREQQRYDREAYKMKEKQPSMVEMSDGHPLMASSEKQKQAVKKRKLQTLNLGERLAADETMSIRKTEGAPSGNLEMTVRVQTDKESQKRVAAHKTYVERKKSHRSAKAFIKKQPSQKQRGYR